MPKNFVVYKSSAGSGKTFTLVKEYLKLALANEHQIQFNYKRILALTFTNKAAAEMRNRVVNSLKTLTDPQQSSDLENIICKELGIANEDLKSRSQKLLDSILHHYSDFAVSTIDSFSHKIIKTFAHDLKLPVNFNLETDTEEFYKKVTSQLISEIGHDQKITDLLKEYALSKVDENLSWDPENNMSDFIKLLQKENSFKHIANITALTPENLGNLKNKLQGFISEFKKVVRSKGNETLSIIKQAGLNDNDFHGKSKGPQKFFKKCAEFDIENALNSTINEALNDDKWMNGKADTEALAKFEKIRHKVVENAHFLADYFSKNSTTYNLYTLINKQLYPILLLNKIQEIANTIKQDEQLVFIEEFNSKIFEFIKNEPVAFIYERLGERFKHFLIDEFQDTSSLQWHNILPLVDNSLASGNFNLLVGDGKQSIYRWRNANVKQFAMLPEMSNPDNNPFVKEQIANLKRNYEEKILNTNFRSVSTIIDFNNKLFGFLSKELLKEPLLSIYNDQAQEIKNTETGYISIVTENKDRSELDDFVFGQILNNVNTAISSKFNYKDICIITFTNKDGSKIANFLSKQNIPVVSNDSLMLNTSAEVNVLINFFRYIQNNKDLVSGASVINYFLSTERINTLQFHRSISDLQKTDLFSVLNNNGIAINENDVILKNVFDISVTLIEKLGLNKNESANIYLRFFLDEISKFMASKSSNMNDFLEWWIKRSEKASLIISEDIDAVKIMTIHGSKGLEFPVVIIPYCNWSYSKQNELWIELKDDGIPLRSAFVPINERTAKAGYSDVVEEEDQEKLLDNLNILYVAFTRAVERLHIITSNSLTNKKKSVDDWIKKFISANQFEQKANGIYEFGIIKDKTSKHKNDSAGLIELSSLQYHTGSNAIKIKGSYLNNSELNESAKEKGILMHYILSKIKYKEDSFNALNDVLKEGLIVSSEIDEYKTIIDSIINSPELEKYFTSDNTVKIEHEIITHNGDVLRPDRIVITKNETCIIDYKTGKENHKKYTHQMIEYASALQQMNYSNIKKLLVYIEDFKVIEVY